MDTAVGGGGIVKRGDEVVTPSGKHACEEHRHL